MENDSVQNAHIAKNERSRILCGMERNPNQKALAKFKDKPFALTYENKIKKRGGQ